MIKRAAKQTSFGKLMDFLQRWGMELMLGSAGIVMTVWIAQQLSDPLVMPVKVVGVDGEMRFLQPAMLEQAVSQAVTGSFFSVDLVRVRSAVEALPWVDKVSIRRVWPDTLKVRVVEQQPLARWGQDALLNRQGEVFRPQPLPKLPQLALLEGEIADAKSISREYQRIETLMNTVGLKLNKVRVDARQAWLLQTRNGIELNLGRKRILPRLTRFVRLYPRLAATRQARLKLVDLRYPNGFSARWESLPEMQSNRHDPAEWGHASRLAGI